MDTLKVTLIQADLHWEDPVKNRSMFAEKMESLANSTDLIILPEMFTTGFSMNALNLAEPMNGPTLQWMQDQSIKTGAVIAGSLIVKENGQFFNRLLWVEGLGTLHYYDKKHTFTLAGEDKVYTAGSQRLVLEYKGWKICPLICYDLRFPVWSRNTENYDLLIYCANWPAKRITAWDTLLKARAIENMSFCIGVNRVGEDGNGHDYIGHSAVYDALGGKMFDTEWEHSFMQTITINKKVLLEYRNHLQFLNDRDEFTLT